MDRLKNVKKYLELYRWKLDRAGYTEDIECVIEEVEQLRKEKEWLIERASFDVYSFMYPTKKEKRQYIIDQMQQALKERR